MAASNALARDAHAQVPELLPADLPEEERDEALDAEHEAECHHAHNAPRLPAACLPSEHHEPEAAFGKHGLLARLAQHGVVGPPDVYQEIADGAADQEVRTSAGLCCKLRFLLLPSQPASCTTPVAVQRLRVGGRPYAGPAWRRAPRCAAGHQRLRALAARARRRSRRRGRALLAAREVQRHVGAAPGLLAEEASVRHIRFAAAG
mmetsp:Transcript_28782/g.82395  ORF Transcript_28782/g.82395 Transcript_28782/m.82395 type:complete len:205 (+) Transcript_28782:230-844(+)